MRFVSYADRKAVAGLLKPIYTAASEEAALMGLAAFADSTLGVKYPAAVRTWEHAWERFTPFLAFGPALRKLIYTTNSIVIWSPLGGVLHVGDEAVGFPVLRAGRGYLPSSTTQILGGSDAGGPGGDARLAA
jgi:hypothetical protein